MDLDKLIQPLSSSPTQCGEDMLFSSEFDEIQEARRFDDPSLAQGEWVTEIKEADWAGVICLCESVLSSKSKDLRIASWFAEAKCKQEGLPGLAEGYELLTRLVENFWDNIHPLPEDGDLEQRVGVLDWLSNQTSRLIREVPLTSSHKGRFSLLDLESARATAKNIERNPGQAEEISRDAQVTLELFESAARDTPKRHFLESMQAAKRLKEAIETLEKVLDQRMGELAPAFATGFDALDDAQRLLQRYSGESEEAPIPSATMPTQTSDKALGSGQGIDPHFGSSHFIPADRPPVQSRERAIQQLLEIAEFFRRTEPHSPVAYLAEKAAKWGKMPLHEWLRSVVKDDSALLRMEELLGVDQGSSDSF